MDISMDIHEKSVDMDMDMDVTFHIHGNPGYWTAQGPIRQIFYRRSVRDDGVDAGDHGGAEREPEGAGTSAKENRR